jgi:hypothetical protein
LGAAIYFHYCEYLELVGSKVRVIAKVDEFARSPMNCNRMRVNGRPPKAEGSNAPGGMGRFVRIILAQPMAFIDCE